MVFPTLWALLCPVDAYNNHPPTDDMMRPYRLIQRTHRDMPTAAVIRQPYIMCPCHVRADADTCDASLYVMPCGIRA
ncbi:MAG: hypothetical protein IJR53_11190 [Bacteroidales bacterium]|nr:hypothetical protein [Bacteroidales bacterium]